MPLRPMYIKYNFHIKIRKAAKLKQHHGADSKPILLQTFVTEI